MEQNHIINKVVIEVSVNNKERANDIKDNISSFLAMDVFPELEKHFNAVQATLSPTDILQIQRLSIDLNSSESSLNATLQKNILESVEKEFAKAITPALVQQQDIKTDSVINLLGEKDKLLNTFIHFIEKGYMPWWNSNEKSIDIFEPEVFKKIVTTKAFAPKVVLSIQKKPVQERIINQFTDSQIKQICLAVIKAKNLGIVLNATSVKQLLKQSFENRKAFWSLILNALIIPADNLEEYIIKETAKIFPSLKTVKKDGNEEHIREQILSVFPFIKQNDKLTALKKSLIPEKRAKKNNENRKEESIELKNQTGVNNYLDKTTDEKKGYYLHNAGLVLIHPFMVNLFKHCNLIDPQTKKLSDPETCIHLLHYIATGKTNQPESDMLFEKFLCNIPFQQSISRHIKLSHKHKSEAAKVIAAVQENWSSMKTASVGLLQNEFFQRPGKLILTDNQTLTIERKTQDILLDRLTWGISFIKLPWQKEFIYVNW